MPLMKLAKNRVYASTLGHVIRFVKNQPVNVPPIMVKECENIGAVRIQAEAKIEKAPLRDEEELAAEIAEAVNTAKVSEGIEIDDTEAPAQPVAPLDRMEVISDAIDVLYERNARGDFTAAGKPNLKVLAKETGFRVDKNELKEALVLRNETE